MGRNSPLFVLAGPTPADPKGAAGINCCFVNFGGQLSSFIDNVGIGCGLTPRPRIGNGSEALVVWGAPNPTPGGDMFGAGLQNLGAETVFRPRKSTSSYFLLKWGVQIQYLFNQKPNTPF